jgi:hypothetical protein
MLLLLLLYGERLNDDCKICKVTTTSKHTSLWKFINGIILTALSFKPTWLRIKEHSIVVLLLIQPNNKGNDYENE